MFQLRKLYSSLLTVAQLHSIYRGTQKCIHNLIEVVYGEFQNLTERYCTVYSTIFSQKMVLVIRKPEPPYRMAEQSKKMATNWLSFEERKAILSGTGEWRQEYAVETSIKLTVPRIRDKFETEGAEHKQKNLGSLAQRVLPLLLWCWKILHNHRKVRTIMFTWDCVQDILKRTKYKVYITWMKNEVRKIVWSVK